MLKRKRDAEDEEERQKRDLEVRLAFEAARREPEPQPVRHTDLTHRKESHTEVFQVPLLERVIDVRLQRSVRTRRLPVRFRDPVPTSTTPNPRTAAA